MFDDTSLTIELHQPHTEIEMTTINGWHFSCFLSLIWCVLISEYFIPHIVLLFAFESLFLGVYFFFHFLSTVRFTFVPFIIFFFVNCFRFYFCLFIFFLMSVSIFFCFVRSFCFQRGACTFFFFFVSFARLFVILSHLNAESSLDRRSMAQIKLVNSLQLLVRRQLVWMLHFKYFTPIIVHCLVDPFSLRYAEMKILLNGQHSNRKRNVFLFEFDFKHKIYLRDHISSLQLSSNGFLFGCVLKDSLLTISLFHTYLYRKNTSSE